MEALDLIINLPVVSFASMFPSVCPALCISFPFISFPHVVTTLVSYGTGSLSNAIGRDQRI